MARLLAGGQAVFLALNPFLCLSACAQMAGPSAASSTATGAARALAASDRFLAQGTILPTDVVPLPAAQERTSFGENLQLRVLQRLPARFYFNSSIETSIRYETNVFQFPTKRKFLSQIFQTTPPPIFRQLNAFQQGQIIDTLGLVSTDDLIFRALPNVSGGWTLTPRTRIFGNYFMIRDSLFNTVRLNTVIHSVAFGAQQDIPVGRRGNLQLEFQARELYQIHSQAVFDFLPAMTFSYILTPRTVAFVNALFQLRGKKYFQAPTKEMDPFYTFGFLYQRGGWSLSSTGTFVQNFREPFRGNASIPQNNYSWILDFEIARRLIKQLPGLQAFIRAEPIYNFHSHNRPGLAGMDFRLFWGLRFAMGKPPLTAALEQIRQQLEEQEGTPPPPGKPGQPGPSPAEPKPSAYLMPYQVIAGSPQPIHGLLAHSPDPLTGRYHHGDNMAIVKPGLPEIAAVPAVFSQPSPETPVLDLTSAAVADSESPADDAFRPVPPAAAPQSTAAAPASLASLPAPAPAVVPAPDEQVPDPVAAAGEKAQAPLSEPVPVLAAVQAGPGEQIEEITATARPYASLEPVAAASATASPEPGAGEGSQRTGQPQRKTARRSEKGQKVAARKSDVEMVLVPPLPRVNPDSANPFAESGLELKPPALFVR